MLENLLKKYKNKKTTRIDSLIGQDTEIQGEIRFSGGVHIDGKIKGKVIGEHEVRFFSGKEIIKLNHESFHRALYSEGALTAAAWLMSKKVGLYSMRDLLNFK